MTAVRRFAPAALLLLVASVSACEVDKAAPAPPGPNDEPVVDVPTHAIQAFDLPDIPPPDVVVYDAFIPTLDLLHVAPPDVFVEPVSETGPPCMPVVETCNGVDDNCNDEIDEGFIIGRDCWLKQDACVVQSSRICDPAGVPLCPLPAEAECRQKPLVFAVFGDYGSGGRGESLIADLVRSWDPDFIVTTGNNNYPQGAAETIDRNVGQFFGTFIGGYRGTFGSGPDTDANRFWPTLGEADWATNAARPYLDFFTLPGNERYYDVDLGLVHLFLIDSDRQEPDGIAADSVQAQWFTSAIAKSRACLDLVFFHNPPYSSAARGDRNGGAPLRWPFAALGVEAVFTGYDHFYERLEVEGVPHFVVGYTGADNHTFADPPRAESLFRYRDKPGALKVSVDASQAWFEFYNREAVLVDSSSRPLACPAAP